MIKKIQYVNKIPKKKGLPGRQLSTRTLEIVHVLNGLPFGGVVRIINPYKEGEENDLRSAWSKRTVNFAKTAAKHAHGQYKVRMRSNDIYVQNMTAR